MLFEKLVRMSNSELIGKNLFSLKKSVDEHVLRLLGKHIKSCLESSKYYETEETLKINFKKYIMKIRFTPVEDSDKKVNQVICSFLEMNRLRKIEKKTLLDKERYENQLKENISNLMFTNKALRAKSVEINSDNVAQQESISLTSALSKAIDILSARLLYPGNIKIKIEFNRELSYSKNFSEIGQQIVKLPSSNS